jgi:hypothetical protein
MRKEDLKLVPLYKSRLRSFSKTTHSLVGIGDPKAEDVFIFQMIESIRRIRFIKQVSERHISLARKDPDNDLFDPVRAAMLHHAAGDLEEACWLIFLFTHTGKNIKSGYQLLRDIYGKLGTHKVWTWATVSKDPLAFRHWLDKNMPSLRASDKHRAFGNHRKYQSLDAWKPNGTGDAVQSYVQWVKTYGSHSKMFNEVVIEANHNPERAFNLLYKSMRAVNSFGRTARFDYLSMIGKVGLASIRPDSVHLKGATGPVLGAKLFFYGTKTSKQSDSHLEHLADDLATFLGVDKQVMEDSLCNWQKDHTTKKRFRG